MSQTEKILYYNNHFAIVDGNVKIDRIYPIDESAFTERDYEKLGAIYKGLPGFFGDSQGCPYWYGHDDEFHLTVSFEPVGLQLTGLLEQNEFARWERAFHTSLENAGFPYIR